MPYIVSTSRGPQSLGQLAKANPLVVTGAVAAAGLVAMALFNRSAARKAERKNPPAGRFLTVDGCRLHYIEQGSGTPVIMLHGNGSMIQDFRSSGLIDLVAAQYRVLAFDRPGYGHSDRPRRVVWTADRQADLVHKALQQLSIERALVFGHSWGASVAMSLALRHPGVVQGLVVASGYYFPGPRADAVLLTAPAVPVLGDIIRYTISPALGRLAWPAVVRKLFAPRKVPAKFAGFPKEMALRPSQIRASAAETALLIPAAMALSGEYGTLKMPVTIIAGTDDQLINTAEQSARLHRAVSQSDFICVEGDGHMLLQTASAAVAAAVEATDRRSPRSRGSQTLLKGIG